MPPQTQSHAATGRPSIEEAIVRAEAALAVRAQGTSSTGQGQAEPARPSKGQGKASQVQGSMFWRILFLYAGSATVLNYAMDQMRAG
jgi:amino acid permease